MESILNFRLPTLLRPDFQAKDVFFFFSTKQVMAAADTADKNIAQ